jgi:predicted Zn-dependent protease
LPSPKPHPLPTTLEAWQDNASGDYFDQIKPVIVGYLVWTQFPITIYIDPATATEQAKPFLAKRAQTWIVAVQKAIQEWQPYLPLKIVNQATGADIIIRRSTPPLRLAAPAQKTNDSNPNRPRFEIPRARSAETQFELYARRSPTQSPETPALLAHRVTIHIRPDQAADYLQAAARHELGHALGIWGHSTQPTDALYFSQVRNPATISNRDLNTLKRIYTQPTRLGWPLMARSQEHRQ